MFLSTFVPAKALKFVIGASKLKGDCMLNDTRLIIAEVDAIRSKLVQITEGIERLTHTSVSRPSYAIPGSLLVPEMLVKLAFPNERPTYKEIL